MTRTRFVAICTGLLVVAMAVPVVSQTPTLEDRVTDLENRVAYLETFHPSTTTPPGHTIVYDTDTTLTAPLVLNPGDTVELRNGARLMFSTGAYLDAQGTAADPVSIFGAGDIMFMTGSLASTIRHVTIDVQPIVAVDHYPLHWHFVGDGSRGTLVEHVTVQNSTNRCLVPHASHGITIRDTTCLNIQNDAIWWNPPADRFDNSNDTHDLLLERVTVDGVTEAVTDPNDRNNFGVLLGTGLGNVMRDSMVRNVTGSKNSSAYAWSTSGNNHQGGNIWVFEDNASEASHTCLYAWSSGMAYPDPPGFHPIDNLTCQNDAKVGAYAGRFTVTNLQAPRTELWSSRAIVVGGNLGDVVIAESPQVGPVSITDATIATFTVNDAGGNGSKDVTVTNSGITCADVIVQSVAPGTTVTIDGQLCDLGT